MQDSYINPKYSMGNMKSCSSRWQLAKQIAGWEKPEYPGWLGTVVLGFCFRALFLDIDYTFLAVLRPQLRHVIPQVVNCE